MKRTYHAPVGASSITVLGTTLEVSGDGTVVSSDPAAHDVLLSHGYTTEAVDLAPDATPTRSDLEHQARRLGDELKARSEALDVREHDLLARVAAIDTREAAVASIEMDLALRVHAVSQREAAAPPPPPPAPPVAADLPVAKKR